MRQFHDQIQQREKESQPQRSVISLNLEETTKHKINETKEADDSQETHKLPPPTNDVILH